MKSKIIIIAILIAAIAAPAVCLAAAPNPCSGVNPVQIAAREKAKLKDILENYNDSSYLMTQYGIPSLLYNNTGEEAYYLCFEIAAPFLADETFRFTAKDPHDVYIAGLKIKAGKASPALVVTNPMPLNSIHVHDLSMEGVKSGIILEGEGGANLVHSNIAGDGKKTGPCVTVKSKGTTVDDVMATKCAEGIRIAAKDVSIKSSIIANNGLGVRVAEGGFGTKITDSLIYGNRDESKSKDARLWGIFADSAAAIPEVKLLADKNGVLVKKTADPATGTVSYDNDEEAVLMIPSPPASNEGQIEFFTTDCAGKESNSQACGKTRMVLKLSSESLDGQGVVRLSLPAEYRSMRLVVIYTDPENGSTLLSQPFTTSGSNITAIGPAQFDVPVHGSALEAPWPAAS